MAKALIVNPRKRPSKRRKSTAKKTVARRRNPARRKTGILQTQIMPAAIAAAGAAGANMAFDYAAKYLPAEWQTGNMRFLAEGGIILGLGMVLEQTKVADKKMRDNLVGGALTVTAYRALEQMVAQTGLAPAVTVQGYQRINGYQKANMGYANSAPIMRRV